MDYLPLLLFAAFMVGTPGPANMLLMTSGANFGLVRSLPFLAGVTMGKVLLNLLLALGLWRLLAAQPEVLAALKVVCIAYLCWLALRMSGFLIRSQELKRPETFWSGLAVHPLNPKAWVMLVFAWGHFTNSGQVLVLQAAVIAGTFFAVQVVFHTLWCGGGEAVARAFGGRPAERWLMRVLGLLTVAVVIWAVALDRKWLAA